MASVITISPEHLQDHPVADVLVKAFKDDPVHHWFFQRDYSKYSRWFFETSIHGIAKANNAIVHAVVNEEQQVTSTAVWYLSNQMPSTYSYIVNGFWSLFVYYPSCAGRLLNWDGKIDPLHKQIMGDKPHYYLLFVGSDPDHQGKGYGTKVLREQLTVADEKGYEAFLECTQENNVKFYERLGFKVIECVDGADFPKVWLMKREPQNDAK